MGNSASSLPEHVGGQVQRAAERLQRKVRGKKPVRAVRGDDHGAAPPFAGGRRLAVFCDGCGEIIRPGQRFMPVRGCQDPANDRDLCAACTEAYTPGPAETQFAMSNPIALAASATEPTLNMLQGLSLNETTDSEKTGPTNFAAYDDPLSAV